MSISDVILIAGGALAWYGVVGFALNGVPYVGCRTRARRSFLFGGVLIVLGLAVSGVTHAWLPLLGLSALFGLALQALAWGMNYGLQQPGGETPDGPTRGR
jgi:hypothetical protein